MFDLQTDWTSSQFDGRAEYPTSQYFFKEIQGKAENRKKAGTFVTTFFAIPRSAREPNPSCWRFYRRGRGPPGVGPTGIARLRVIDTLRSDADACSPMRGAPFFAKMQVLSHYFPSMGPFSDSCPTLHPFILFFRLSVLNSEPFSRMRKDWIWLTYQIAPEICLETAHVHANSY